MDHTFWDDRYRQSVELYGKAPNQYFREKIREIPPGNLLIPGEGEGRHAVFAARTGWEVTAFDMSEVARQHALEKAKSLKLPVNYQLSRAEDFTYEKEEFDCAALIYFHLPPAIRTEIHQKIAGAVKPGGHLILEAFHPRQLAYASGGPKDESMLYTAEMLSRDFTGWEWLENFEGEVMLNEGSGHMGKGFVTRLFAMKKA